MLCHSAVNFQPININFLIEPINIVIKTPNMELDKKTESQVKIEVKIDQLTVRLMINSNFRS